MLAHIQKKSESKPLSVSRPISAQTLPKQWSASTKKAKSKVSTDRRLRNVSSFFHSHLTLLCNLPSINCFHDCQLKLQTKALLHCAGHVCTQTTSISYSNANMSVLLHVHRAVKVTDSGHRTV